MGKNIRIVIQCGNFMSTDQQGDMFLSTSEEESQFEYPYFVVWIFFFVKNE